jgi:Holliday junction resolvase RusA-like endonuclease
MIILKRIPFPVSKNALHQPIRCGKFTKLVRTKKAKLRGEEIVAYIWKQLGGVIREPLITGNVRVEVWVTPPDCRPRDFMNSLEHLYDCLEAARVVANDKQIVEMSGGMMPQAVRPGWVDVTITDLGAA